MILWNLLLLLPLAGSVYGDVRYPHEGCNTTNHLYLDKLLKHRMQTGYLSFWNVTDDIVFGQFDRKGVFSMIVWGDTNIELKYVDERILKVSVDNDQYISGHWKTIEIQYQSQRACSEDGVHYMHFEVTNSLRNSSNELVLKYRYHCDYTMSGEERQLDALQGALLRTQWIQDGHCPGPLKTPKFENERALLYKLIYDRGTRVFDVPSDSKGYIIFISKEHGKWSFNATGGNPEYLQVDTHTTSLDSDGLTFSVVKYNSKKPGDTTVDLHLNGTLYRVSLPVFPSFTEFWNTTSFAQTDLVGEPSLFTVWHFDPIKNVGVQFDGPDGNNVFKIQKEFKDHDQIVLVTKHIDDRELKVTVWPPFVAWPVQMNKRTLIIPYRNLMSIGQKSLDQSIEVQLSSYFKNDTRAILKYKLEINAHPIELETTKSPEVTESVSTQKPNPEPSETTGPSSSTQKPNPEPSETTGPSSSTQKPNPEPSETTGPSSSTQKPNPEPTETPGPSPTTTSPHPEPTEEPETKLYPWIVPELELAELKTYSLGNNLTLLMDTEDVVRPDKEGVYHVFKEGTNFAMVFTIEGFWEKELGIEFKKQGATKSLSRTLKADENTWKMIFQGKEGLFTFTLTDPEIGKKLEYSIKIHFKKSIVNVHPPDFS